MAGKDCKWPADVGVVACDIYFPGQYVDQTELEKYDGVSEGKYTIGLGQKKMGIVTDREDTNAMCLTVINNLMEKSGIAWNDIGHLEVGTETIIDKSKSIKSTLMLLWEKHDPDGNKDMEGLDTINACYGGTAALFNALNWIESSAWDGRYALVVMADIAIYGPGSGRPTSGAGAVALIVGPNAPLVIERGTRSTYVENAYDFYKPELGSEYPYIDGKLSVDCYLKALDKCYSLFCNKAEKSLFTGRHTLDDLDYMLFHCPYVKLVQKSTARIGFIDFLRAGGVGKPELAAFKDLKLEDTYNNRDVEKAVASAFKNVFTTKTEASTLISSQVGNMYTASLYACLCSLLLHKKGSELAGKRIGMFSYGSGLAASFFAMRATTDAAALDKMARIVGHVPERMASRSKKTPQFFHDALDHRNRTAHKASFVPESPVADLYSGTWYLVSVDEKHRRSYERKE